jgi:eukaryotic-like serine/threonine-protein kinase
LPGESGPAEYVEPGYLCVLARRQPACTAFRRAQSAGERQRPEYCRGRIGQHRFLGIGQRAAVVSTRFPVQLTWLDPEGKKPSTVGDPGYLSTPAISPDGRYAVAAVVEPGQTNQKLWLYDLNRGTATPFTFGGGNDYYSTWSPDSQQVAFSSTRGSQEDIYVKPVGGGSNEQLLLGGDGNKEPDRWSADGRYIVFDYFSKKTQAYDIWALPVFGDRKPFPVVQSPGTDYYGTFSPDGKWVAYVSDESGRGEIYVMPFPGPEGNGRVLPVEGGNLYGRPAKSCFIAR